ncbi:MAG: DUF2017 family protein [Candidatus Dormibacteria bacterium]
MAQISREGDQVCVRVGRGERRALLQILERLERMVPECKWANPRAYQEEEAEAEFRRLVGSELTENRNQDLAQVHRGLEADQRILLSVEEAVAWMRALNVLRLALGERLGIVADGWEDHYTLQQHRQPPLATLHLLSWVQEGLVEALNSPGTSGVVST